MLRVFAVLVGLLALQVRVFNGLSVDGYRPALFLLVPIGAAIDGDATRAASTGFAAGLFLDLFLDTPFGLAALVFAVVGYGVAAVERSVIRSDVWLQPAVAGTATAFGVVGLAAASALFGQPAYLRPSLLFAAAFAGLINLILAAPVVRVVRWALGPVQFAGALRA